MKTHRIKGVYVHTHTHTRSLTGLLKLITDVSGDGDDSALNKNVGLKRINCGVPVVRFPIYLFQNLSHEPGKRLPVRRGQAVIN